MECSRKSWTSYIWIALQSRQIYLCDKGWEVILQLYQWLVIWKIASKPCADLIIHIFYDEVNVKDLRFTDDIRS